MGLTYRHTACNVYTRFVRIGKRTVKDGESVVVWNRTGQSKQHDGPCLLHLWYSTIRFLVRHTATPNEYLQVYHRGGAIENVPGPCFMFQNPVLHERIIVVSALVLTKPTQYVLVYERDPATEVKDTTHPGNNAYSRKAKVVVDDGSSDPQMSLSSNIRRRVVKGPTVIVPSPNEWFHVFGGVGQVLDTEASPHVMKVTLGANGCTHGPSLRLCLTYKYTDVNLVAAMANPLQYMEQALRADVVGLGCSWKELLGRSARVVDVLNDTSTFPRLLHAAGEVGAAIKQIAFDGLELSEEMREQERRENAFVAQQREESAQSKQRRELADEQLRHEEERQETEQELWKKKHQLELVMEKEKWSLDMEKQSEENRLRLEFLKSLKELGVDLTTYLATDKGVKKGDTVKKED